MTTKNSWRYKNMLKELLIVGAILGTAATFVGISFVLLKSNYDKNIQKITQQHQQERRSEILNELEFRLVGAERYLEPEHLDINMVPRCLNADVGGLSIGKNLAGLIIELRSLDATLDQRIVDLTICRYRNEEETRELVKLLIDFIRNAEDYESLREWGDKVMSENKE